MQKKTLLTSAVALSAAAFLLSASPAAFAAASDPHQSVSRAPDHQNLTIYPNFGIVQQTNPIDVAKDANSIRLDGISGQYEPSSLVFVNVNVPGAQLKVKDVSYQPANLTDPALLAASVGTDITVKDSAGIETTGKLLSFSSGTLIIAPPTGGPQSIKDAKNVKYSALPSGLAASPSLTLNADATAAGKGELQILYKTGGFGWSGRYSVTYNEQAGTVDLTTSVAITNNTGTSFKAAGVKVVSGNVQDFREEKSFGRAMPAAAMAAGPGGASFDDAAVGAVGEQKIYTLPATGVEIKDGEIKQVPLYGTKGVPVEKVYYQTNQHRGGDFKQDSNVRLITTNDTAHHIGQSLPPGNVRYYEPEKNAKGQPTGDLQLSASGKVIASEPGDKMLFEMGSTRDVKATWSLVKEVDGVRQQNGKATPSTYDWSVAFTNSKDRDVMVKVYESAGTVKVTNSSSAFSPEGGQQFTWVKVPAHGSATLTYTTVEQN